MDINLKIKEVKERLTLLTKHFPYTEEQINIFTICYIAIASIDNDITDLLDEVFSRVYILFNNGCFDNMLSKLGCPSREQMNANTLTGWNLNGKDGYEFINIYINNSYGFIIKLFANLIHEIKHSINNIINCFKKKYNESFIFFGLSFIRIDEYHYKRVRIIIDEFFNSFITNIYLRQIETLKYSDIEDEDIKSILNSFCLGSRTLYSYSFTTKMWEKLLSDQDVFTIFYNAALYHDYLPLNKFLAKIFSQDMKGKAIPFDDLLDYLDVLSEIYENGQRKNNISDYFEKMSSGYPKRELKIKPYFDNI